MTPYFVPASLFQDLSGLQCPLGVEKIGERAVQGHLIPVVRVTTQQTARHLELELGRPVEMHTLPHNKPNCDKMGDPNVVQTRASRLLGGWIRSRPAGMQRARESLSGEPDQTGRVCGHWCGKNYHKVQACQAGPKDRCHSVVVEISIVLHIHRIRNEYPSRPNR
jgi:hypothetical protein